jgi:hypothetical protein
MSSFGVGLGSWKKGGRVADSSAVTENIRRVAQGQADATYVDTQKKNPFRMSSAILNGYSYNSAVLVKKNQTDGSYTSTS